MDEAEQGTTLPRVGLVAIEEVRGAGLTSLLGAHGYQAVHLADPHSLEASDLRLVIIDSSASEHLLQLLESFRRLRSRVRLLVLGRSNDLPFVEAAIGAGARGVLSYEATEAELLRSLEEVAAGSIWAPRKVLATMLDRAGDAAQEGLPVHLTGKELEVLKLLNLGLSNREIANELAVAQATVKAHLGRLMRKADVRSRTALGMHAVARKWV